MFCQVTRRRKSLNSHVNEFQRITIMLSGDKKKKKAKMMNIRVLLTNVVCWVTRRRQKAKPNQ
jgi:hypothetical protein